MQGKFQRHTDIDASESGKIQGSANDIRSALGENDVPAIVTFLHRFQDVIRIVCLEIVVALDNAFLGSLRRGVHLLVRTLRRVNQGWSDALVCLHASVVALHIFLVGSPSGEGACGLQEPKD